MQITLRQLEIFAAICQEGAITRAAHRIGLSQAAASQALAELENQLQRRVFDRKGRRLIQNAAGADLLPVAIGVLDRVREIERGARTPAVNIRLSASLTVGNYMLPSFIGRFARSRAGAHIEMDIGNTEQVVSSVQSFESDAGWIEGRLHHPDLRLFPWREDRLEIIASPKHPLAGRKVTSAALAQQPWVLREKGSGTREVFEEAIAGKFTVERASVQMGGIGAVKRAVMTGVGLGCVSRSAIELELKARQLAVVHAPWLDLRRQIVLVIHRQKYLGQGLREFLEFCGVKLPKGAA